VTASSSRESANHRFLSGARNIVRLRLPPWRTQSHPSRNCLTANSVTHLSGRFLRLGKSIMGEPKKVVAPKDSRHYREVASKLRGIARQSSLPVTRQKILDFALRFEGIAKQVDRRSPTVVLVRIPAVQPDLPITGYALPLLVLLRRPSPVARAVRSTAIASFCHTF